MRVTQICTTCGRPSVLVDAWVMWNVEEQAYKIYEIHPNKCFCSHCSGETRFKEVKLKGG